MPFPTLVFYPEGRQVQIDVMLARTPSDRARGLEGVPRLASGLGMLFVWPADTITAFTTARTWFPLDIVYLGGDGLVVDVQTTSANDPFPYHARVTYRAALEVPAGWAFRNGIQTGVAFSAPPAVWQGAT